MQYQATGRWNDDALRITLTAPEVAQEFWASRMAENIRREFDGRETTFMAYVAELHIQTGHPATRSGPGSRISSRRERQHNRPSNNERAPHNGDEGWSKFESA
jgi:hypothetical protein